jgi:hypothetical protein
LRIGKIPEKVRGWRRMIDEVVCCLIDDFFLDDVSVKK